MIRILTATLVLGALPAFAQPAHVGAHVGHAAGHHQGMAGPAAAPKEPGQGAFAAIQEIVQILAADPRTDWSKVDIEALRRHLIDMSNVTLGAAVAREPAGSGVRFTVTGAGPVRDSIRRMLRAHAAMMDGAEGWRFAAAEVADGAILTVTVPPADLAKLRALGFIGVLTQGMHHQAHHLMIARGEHPHG